MKKVSLICLFLLITHVLHAQISYPKVRKFNAGLFLGLGGESGPVLNLIPALNLSYRSTTLTAGLSLNKGFTVGVVQDIVPISVSHSNVKWIVSGFYSQGLTDRYYTEDTDYNTFSLLTGLRLYFAKRWFSNIQGGVSYTSYETKAVNATLPKDPSYSEWQPYFEFGLGFRLFKTFEEKNSKEKKESTE
jgi:ABC-type antimicrobial peptide transport system permease subunit